MNQPPDIGALLRDTRSRFGWSLEDVAHRTRIPVAHLRHLECNEYEPFPSRSYAKGFLTQYSDYLGIDSIEWIDAFESLRFTERDHHEVPEDLDERVDAAPLVLKRDRPRKLSVQVEAHDDDTDRRTGNSGTQPLLVFSVTAALITGAVFAFMKLSENLSPEAAELAQDSAESEPLAPVRGINSGRPTTTADLSSVPRALPVTSEDNLITGEPIKTSGTETLRATPTTTQEDIPNALVDFTLDNPPPRAVIVEE